MPIVNARLRSTNFFDTEEAQKARALVAEDRAWFEIIKNARGEGLPADPTGLAPPFSPGGS
jgi:hypothetical protein